MQICCESVIINNFVACYLFLVYAFFSYAFIFSWREALSRILTNLIFILIIYFIALIAPPSWEEPIAYFVQVYTIISIVPTITTIISAIK